MDPRADRDLIRHGLRAAAAPKTRGLAAAGLLASLILLFPVLLLPLLSYLLAAGLAVWAVWALVGGAIIRSAGLELAGRARREGLGHALRRWPTHFGAPLLLVLYVALLGAIVLGVLQVLRIPVAGWVLLFVLSPVVLLLGGAAVWLLVRFVLVEHLVSPAVALGGAGAFGSLTRSMAWLRSAPRRVIGLRNVAVLLLLVRALLGVILAAAVLGGVWLLLPEAANDAVMKALRRIVWLTDGLTVSVVVLPLDAVDVLVLVLLSLVVAWVLAAPAAMVFGAHAALYLLHRRDLDGVALDVPPSDAAGSKSLEELGFALVKRLGAEPEVS